MPERSVFTVPNWFVAVIKWSAPAIGVGIWMYVQVALMQKDIDSLKSQLATVQSGLEARGDGQQSLTHRVDGIEIRQTTEGKMISDSLSRIEGNMRDMQADIKEMNRRIPEKR